MPAPTPREMPIGSPRRGPSRRQFLTRAALLAVGAPALPILLDACSKGGNSTSAPSSLKIASPQNPVTWDIPADNTPIADGLTPEQGATLQLYSYADYVAPDAVKSFEEKYKTTVQVSTFNDTDEAITKIRGGNVDYDIYFPSYDQISRLVNGGLLKPLNHSYIPNIKNVWPVFTNPWYDQEWRFTVPYTVYTTGLGWRADQVPENYTMENFRAWTERSRRLLAQDTLDLVQLHCPPSAVIDDDATYDVLDQLVAEGVIAAYGVSVETMDQALSALRRPNLTNLQIIFNPFRLKPLDEVLPLAAEKGVAVFARVPLASGLLSGKYTAETTFDKDDHRTYNRNGEAFDKGARLLGLGFPGGPAIQRAAASGRSDTFELPRAWLPGTHDFSFSGLKTQVLLAWQGSDKSDQTRADVARGFEEAIVDTLRIKCLRALEAAAAAVSASVRLSCWVCWPGRWASIRAASVGSARST